MRDEIGVLARAGTSPPGRAMRLVVEGFVQRKERQDAKFGKKTETKPNSARVFALFNMVNFPGSPAGLPDVLFREISPGNGSSASDLEQGKSRANPFDVLGRKNIPQATNQYLPVYYEREIVIPDRKALRQFFIFFAALASSRSWR